MINIDILPIAFSCRTCKQNFRKEYTGSYPCKCPNCGCESMSHTFIKLPQHSFSKFSPANYNLLNSHDKKCQFLFTSLDGTSLSILTDPRNYDDFEFDFSNYSQQIKQMILTFRFEYFGDREKLEEFLKKHILPFEKEHSINYAKNKIEETLISMYELNRDLKGFHSDLEELETPDET